MERKTLWLAVAVFLAAPVASADIYRWQDANGEVHFSDQAPAHVAAERIERPARADRSRAKAETWEATSADGVTTRLTMRANGIFLLRKQRADSKAGLVLRGTWSEVDETRSFQVQSAKRMAANGKTETFNPDNLSFDVQRSDSDNFGVRIDGEFQELTQDT